MPHRPNRSYVSNSDAFDEMTPYALDLLRATGSTLPADAFATELQARAGISMDGLAPSSWVDKVLDRVDRETARLGEPSLRARVTVRPVAARARASERRPPVRRPDPAPQSREVTCPSCWMIVPEAATCRSCGEPLPS